MKKTSFIKVLSLTLCIVLIAVTALLATGCGNNTNSDANTTEAAGSAVTILGEGDTVFTFKSTDVDGKVSEFEIHTDEETVGAALLEVELIAGDDSEYGLYVKTVNGVTLDYDTDGKYWAFYENGQYAMAGVDSTAITEGTVYEFRAE